MRRYRIVTLLHSGLLRTESRNRFHALVICLAISGTLAALPVAAQNRDFQTGRLVIDDNGDDGGWNTMTLQAPNPLGRNVLLTMPDPGTDTVQLLLAPYGSAGAWLLDGNAGTTAGTHFLGTSDATALHLYVNGGLSNGLILNTNGSLQRDTAGDARGVNGVDLQRNRSNVDQVASGAYAVIGGGRQNRVAGLFGVISGGERNSTGDSPYGTVGGGEQNSITGGSAATWSTIAGGSYNVIITGDATTVGGGSSNEVSGSNATISGGVANRINGPGGTIGGGEGNRVDGVGGTVGGGFRNIVAGEGGTIPGGIGLTLSGNASFGYLGNNLSHLDRTMRISDPNTVVFGNTDLWLAANDGTASRLRLYESNSDTGAFPPATIFYTSFEAGDQAADINYILPTARPVTNGRVLSSDTNGVMSWSDGGAVAWSLTGNAGTTPGTNYIGTSDTQALHIYVNGGVDNGLIFNTNGSIQRDTGGIVRGLHAVDLQMIRLDSTEVASGIYSVIGGGRENLADTIGSTVAGGTQNRATGYKSFVGGGDDNWADGSYSVVAGGNENFAYGWKNFIGGGDENQTDYDYAVVAGGNENIAVADGAFIGGGEHNFVAGGDGAIAGGYYNEAWGEFSAVGGGVANVAYGGISAIPGGAGLTLGGDGSFGYLGRNFGDNNMTILDSNLAVFGNVDLWLANNDTTARQLRFYEAESDSGSFPSGTNYTSFEAGNQSEDISYVLPTAAPTANDQVLASDTNGVMSWIDNLAGWSLTGNTGTTPGTNFLGTTDGRALHLYVNGGTSNSLILNTNGSIQRNTAGNARGDRSVDMQALRGLSTEVASGAQSVIGGGRENGASGDQAVVAGGFGNVASGGAATVSGGKWDTASGTSSTVGGGLSNVASGEFSTVGGGESNTASQYRSAVSGGYKNTASGVTSTVGGGLVNAATGQSSTVGGGANNTAVGSNSAIGGGAGNSASSGNATVGGGSNNTASGISSTVSGGGGNTASAQHASVGGGNANTAQGESSTIGGGLTNLTSGVNATVAGGALSVASGNNSTVGGGNRDTASGDASTVSGGQSNHASQNYATIGGGQSNIASQFHSTVGGGSRNTASGAISTVAGGKFNLASGANSTVGGGISDTASGLSAVVSGGSSNRALGDYSTVAGGANNIASVQRSTISGGYQNTASGPRSTVSGGEGNMASGDYSNIGGGWNDTASGANATVSGGRLNRASGEYSTVGGGWNNIASGARSVVSGGYLNTASGRYSAIAGGSGLTLDSSAGNSFGFLGGSSVLRPMTISTPDVAVFGNTDLWLANNDNGASQLRFYEVNSTTGAFPGTTNYSSFEAQAQTADIRYILPDTAGITGDFLSVKSVSGSQVKLDWAAQNSINVSDSAWGLAGNSGTTPGTNFIGTTDSTALHLYVNGGTLNGLILNTDGSIQRNTAGDARGAAAVDLQITRETATQVASGDYATVSGGESNVASAGYAVVGGGLRNGASGTGSTVSGGLVNVAAGYGSAVSGGNSNTASGVYSTVGGGQADTASGDYSTIGGGYLNAATGDLTAVSGGGGNIASGDRATVSGGTLNTASGFGATVSGGRSNTASGDYTMIAGGRGLTLDTAADRSFGFLGGNQTGSTSMTISAPDVAVFGNTDLWLANNDTTASRLLFYEANSSTGAFPNGTHYTSFEAGPQSADISYILPNSTAPSSTVKAGILQLDTATGQLSWLDATQVTGGTWLLSGNAGIPGGSFIGTTDSKPVRIYVNNGDGNVLILNTNGSLQRSLFGGTRGIGAVDLQRQGNLAEGALGSNSTIGGGSYNNVAGDYSVIPGGANMTLNAGADGSFGFLSNANGHPMTISTPNIAVFGNSDLWLANNDNMASRLRFYEASGAIGAFPSASTFYTSFEAGDQSEDINYVLPTAPPTGNGQVLSSDTNGVMSWADGGGTAWSLTGNAGTTPGTHYIGTSDTTALHLYVNGGTVNSLILNTNGSIQRDTAGNARGDRSVDMQALRGLSTEVASGAQSVIGGGRENGASGDQAVVAGGFGNVASGSGATVSGGKWDTASALFSTVGGGSTNVASGEFSTIGGGGSNTASEYRSAVSGGYQNTASGVASTVGGGGVNAASGPGSTVAGGANNTASGNGATVGGGGGNTASLGNATVGGGSNNTASGIGSTVSGGGVNTASAQYATVGGGISNTAQGTSSTVGGGTTNGASGENATVGGGARNLASGFHSTVGGGNNDTASGNASTVSGGQSNHASQSYATIGGGQLNIASDFHTTIGGGSTNTASGIQSTVAGGKFNVASGQYASVGGGTRDTASGNNATVSGGSSNRALAENATVAGGASNKASAARSTVSGGYLNTASGIQSTVSGGEWNVASGENAVVGGGQSDTASGENATVSGGRLNRAFGEYSTVGGGWNNIASGARSVVSGGYLNTASGQYSAIAGGSGLTLDSSAGNSFGFQGGSLFKVMTISTPDVAVFSNVDLWLANNDNGAGQIRFYEAYNTSGAFPNGTNYSSFQAQAQTADIEYVLPAAAGTVGQQLTISAVAGTTVTLGWAAASDRAKKTNFLTLSGEDILKKFRGLDLGTWRYDPAIDPKGTRHYGIMAQDFHAAFGSDGLGEIGTDTTVTNLDLHGVSYLAIQGLEKRTDGNSGRIREQGGEIEELKGELESVRLRNMEQAGRIEEQAGEIEELKGELESVRLRSKEQSEQIESLRRMIETMREEQSR